MPWVYTAGSILGKNGIAPTYAGDTDIAGEPRPGLDAAYSIGAHEQQYITTNPEAAIYGNLILDAGVVYKNFVSPSELGTRLGATKGGSTFIVEQELKDIPVDGAHGPVEGSKRIVSVRPKLTINFIEISQKILNRAFPGSDISNLPATHKQFSRSLTIDDSDYLTNVVLVAQMIENDDPAFDFPIIVGVENAISDGNIELSFLDKEESGCSITFAGHFESDNLDFEPWFVHIPANL